SSSPVEGTRRAPRSPEEAGGAGEIEPPGEPMRSGRAQGRGGEEALGRRAPLLTHRRECSLGTVELASGRGLLTAPAHLCPWLRPRSQAAATTPRPPSQVATGRTAPSRPPTVHAIPARCPPRPSRHDAGLPVSASRFCPRQFIV